MIRLGGGRQGNQVSEANEHGMSRTGRREIRNQHGRGSDGKVQITQGWNMGSVERLPTIFLF